MTAGGREFQVAGAAQLKDRMPISVRLNGTSRNGTADDRSDRVPLCALMCRLRYAGADVCHILNVSTASFLCCCNYFAMNSNVIETKFTPQ